MMRAFLPLFSLFIILLAVPAQADTDEGLYDPKAPEGSAFVRFINETNEAVTGKANKKDFGAVEADGHTAYYVVPQGSVTFLAGDKEVAQEIVEGGFYTALLHDDLKIIEDKANTNPAKATLALINTSQGASVTLKAKENSVDIFKDVENGAMSAREINPVKIDLTINGAEGTDPIALESIVLERGNHYTVLFDGKAGKVIMAQTDTTR